MSYERKVVAAAIKDRKAYEAIAPHVGKGDFTEQAALLWGCIGDYYARDGDSVKCDPSLLSNEVVRKIANDKHRTMFAELVQQLGAMEVSPENIVHDYIQVKKEAAGDRLASALLAGKSTDELVTTYQYWLDAERLGEEEEEKAEVYIGMDIKNIVEAYDPASLIPVMPKALNDRLDGGLLRGHHLVVFARPEMGKTAFVINAMDGFLKSGLKVMYCGNEEPIEDTALRVIARLTGRTKGDVLSSPTPSYEKALDMGYGRLIKVKLWPGSPAEIEALVDKFKPDVLVVDQLRNLRMNEDNYTQSLEKAATAMRNIGKKHNCMVMSVTQAGDSATGKQVLDMGDVDSSNTGIPAQADVMVGIGASTEDENMGRRVLCLPKNKRSGRHDHFPVKVDFAVGKMIGVG